MRRDLLMVGALAAGLAVSAAAVWLRPTPDLDAPATPPETRARVEGPNVLVIVWDTVRADHLSVYGYDKPTTPGLEAMAASSRVYTQARSPAIWTLPAHAALFTGLPAPSTGADERWIWLDGHHLTLAEWFAEHGYDTLSFAANPLLSPQTNLTQGFGVVYTTGHVGVRKAAARMTRARVLDRDRSNELTQGWKPPEHGATNAEWGKAVYKDAAPLMAAAMARFIDNRRDGAPPWFIFLNFMEAHTPRNPSLEARMEVMDDETHERSLVTDQGHINLHFYNFGKHDYSEEEIAAIRAVYDATLVDLDAITSAIVAGLRKRDLLDDTIVVLTSDHGENLGDHHLFNHRFDLHDSLAHVPLIIHYPAGLPPGRIDTPVSTLDLFATLTELAGLPTPEGLVSRSLVGDPPASPPTTHLAVPLKREIRTVAEVHPDVEVEPWLRSGDTWIDGAYKLISLSDGTELLYDITRDPGETDDLSSSEPEVVARLKAELAAWREARPTYDASLRTEADDPRTVRADQEELRGALEALGYMHDAEPE